MLLAGRRSRSGALRASVVIGSWNRPDSLALSLNSALAQTVADIEVLVVEAEGDRRSRETVRETGDPRARWLRLRRGDHAAAFACGCRSASAPVVAYLAQEDLWHPLHLETLLDTLTHGADLAHAITIVTGPPPESWLLLAGGEPWEPTKLVPLSSLAHRRTGAGAPNWRAASHLPGPVSQRLLLDARGRGARIGATCRPTVFTLAPSWDAADAGGRGVALQAALLERLEEDVEVGERLLAEAVAQGAPVELPALEHGLPGEIADYMRRMHGLEARYGARLTRWTADDPLHYPGWYQAEAETHGRTYRWTGLRDRASVRLDAPAGEEVAVRVVLAHWFDHEQLMAVRLDVDGEDVPLEAAPVEDGCVALTGHASRPTDSPVVEVGVTAPVRSARSAVPGSDDDRRLGVAVAEIEVSSYPPRPEDAPALPHSRRRGRGRTPAVVVEGVTKTFALPHEQSHTLKERALHPLRRSSVDTLEALKDVSFAVEKGEFFGIVGRNGSGKSTLLKCLAGIYKTDAGKIYVNGRLSTFIELGVGFNPDLAARDNVVLNAVMLGVPAREARARFDEIIAFAELEDFVDLKVKNYSSGMLVRLAFATAIQAHADILLIDEVLAVGDAAFQQKCFDVFNRLRDEGRTILFVTHDMGSVTRFCDRALLLHRGEIVTIDDPERTARQYLELNFGQAPQVANDGEAGTRSTIGVTRIEDAWVEDEDGEPSQTFVSGGTCVFRAVVRFDAEAIDPHFEVAWINEQDLVVFAASTTKEQLKTGTYAAGERVELRFAFDLLVAPGRYRVNMTVAKGGGQEVVERWNELAAMMVISARSGSGLLDLPYSVELERVVRETAVEETS